MAEQDEGTREEAAQPTADGPPSSTLKGHEAIRAALRKLGPAARNWSVVSSDHEVQGAGFAVHAEVLSSEEFAGRLKSMRQSPSTRSAEPELTSEEIVEWLNLFDKRK